MNEKIGHLIRSVAAGCAIALVVTGCTSTTPPPPSTTQRPTEERLKDRDERAVLTALRQLDMCALVDAAWNATPGLPTDVELSAESPFACSAALTSTEKITAKVTPRSYGKSEDLPVRVLGGAKTYVDEKDLCRIYMPVSFGLAIEFEGPRLIETPGHSSKCVMMTATALAASAATILAKPDTVLAEPMWDTCSALITALGTTAEEYDIDRYANLLDVCDGFSSPSIALSLNDLNTPPIPDDAMAETIAGTQVYTHTRDGVCFVYWLQGPADSRFARESDYEAYFATSDCAQSRTIAERVINVLKQPPPTDVAPQRPILYAPDEPDNPNPASCKPVPPSVAPPSGALQC